MRKYIVETGNKSFILVKIDDDIYNYNFVLSAKDYNINRFLLLKVSKSLLKQLENVENFRIEFCHSLL